MRATCWTYIISDIVDDVISLTKNHYNHYGKLTPLNLKYNCEPNYFLSILHLNNTIPGMYLQYNSFNEKFSAIQ